MFKSENTIPEKSRELIQLPVGMRNSSAQIDFKKDSDNDGLKDWEEALWKTDPQNPDTDGDGTPDGKEVAEGRNPAIPGPDDYLPSVIPPLKNKKADGIVFNTGKGTISKKEEAPSSLERKKKEEKKPLIFSISPSGGSVGTEVKITGSGFTPTGNTVYVGYAVIKNLPSPDGKTLTFKVEPELPEYFKKLNYPLIYWFYVENTNGLSNYGNFRLSF